MRTLTRWLGAVALGLLNACGGGSGSVTIGGDNTTASNIATLAGVILSSGNETRIATDSSFVPADPPVTAWNGSVFYYRYVVGSLVPTITITPIAQDTTQPPTIRITGGGLNSVAVPSLAQSPPITLVQGGNGALNTISIESTAADGRTQRFYTLRIQRLTPTASGLNNLALSNGAILTPGFSTDQTSYSTIVPFGVASLTVTPSAQDIAASIVVSVNDNPGTTVASGTASAAIPLTIPSPPTRINVRVTAADGETTRNYQVDVTRQGSGNLTGLTMSTGALSPVFQPDVLSYTSSQNFVTQQVSVRPTAAEGTAANILVNESPVVSGAQSQPITLCTPTLDPCNTPIQIVVTSSNGLTTGTYTVTASRDPQPPFQQQAYVKPSNTAACDQFGYSVAVSGTTAAVGAINQGRVFGPPVGTDPCNSIAVPGGGAAYVFTRSGATWSQQALINASNIASNIESGDQFGGSIAVSGDTLAVGAPNKNGARGAVYVFARNSGAWLQQQFIQPAGTNPGDQFGHSIALSADGSTLAVGAPAAPPADPDGTSGTVYLFTLVDGAWQPQGFLTGSDVGGGEFGYSVSIDNDTLAVGAPSSDSGIGRAYVFTRTAGTWSLQGQLQGAISAVAFGTSVSVSGDRAAVGSPDERAPGPSSSNPDSAGAAYVFTRDAGTWDPQSTRILGSNTQGGDRFGFSVALLGDRLTVGAPVEDSNGKGVNNNTTQSDNSALDSGAVYTFLRSGNNWPQQAYIKASNTGGGNLNGLQGDQFGRSLAVTNGILAAGANYESSAGFGVNNDFQDDNSARAAGAAYIFVPFAP